MKNPVHEIILNSKEYNLNVYTQTTTYNIDYVNKIGRETIGISVFLTSPYKIGIHNFIHC